LEKISLDIWAEVESRERGRRVGRGAVEKSGGSPFI
jgi:hypothetical protein